MPFARWFSRAVLILGLFLRSGVAQETSQQGQEQGSERQQKSAESKSEQQKITPQQAEELFRDVDTILNFASKDTALPIKHEVKRRLASREEVVSYLKKNMAQDKDVQRLRRTELVLKKFGLLPK